MLRDRWVEILAVLVASLFGGWLGWRYLHPDERACAKVAKLCETRDREKSLAECRALLDEERRRVGAAGARAEAHCALNSDGCFQALDCLYRAGKRH